MSSEVDSCSSTPLEHSKKTVFFLVCSTHSFTDGDPIYTMIMMVLLFLFVSRLTCVSREYKRTLGVVPSFYFSSFLLIILPNAPRFIALSHCTNKVLLIRCIINKMRIVNTQTNIQTSLAKLVSHATWK